MTKPSRNQIEILKRVGSDIHELREFANRNQVNDPDSYAAGISNFLNRWTDEWYLLYLDSSRPDFFAPWLFSFIGRPSGSTQDVSDFLIDGDVEIPRYSYDDNFNINTGFSHSQVIQGFEPLIFSRRTPLGHKEISLSDQFIQSSCLFWDPMTSSYIQVDERGDPMPMVVVSATDPLVICANRRVMQPYLSAKGKSLIRLWKINTGEHSRATKKSRSEGVFIDNNEFRAQKCLQIAFSDDSLMLCSDGGDIIKPKQSKKALARQRRKVPRKDTRKFWVRDRASLKMMQLPCNDRRHELSPAFFSPEVLLRYQQFPSKYEISIGSIRCEKAGWILQSCYVSSAKEVYCYLCDLALLPESEQDYWRSFNLQLPIGSESDTAISCDFLAEFAEEVSGVNRLRRALNSFEPLYLDKETQCQIWKPQEGSIDEIISKIHPPLIEEYEAYRNFIGTLARATTEGFDEDAIKKWAHKLRVALDSNARSLGALKACLRHLSSEEMAKSIHSPFHKLHREKSAISSHGGKRSKQNQSFIQTAVVCLRQITEAVEKLAKIVSLENIRILTT